MAPSKVKVGNDQIFERSFKFRGLENNWVLPPTMHMSLEEQVEPGGPESNYQGRFFFFIDIYSLCHTKELEHETLYTPIPFYLLSLGMTMGWSRHIPNLSFLSLEFRDGNGVEPFHPKSILIS